METLVVGGLLIATLMIGGMVMFVWTVARAVQFVGREVLSALGLRRPAVPMFSATAKRCGRWNCRASNPPEAHFCRRCGQRF